MFTAARLRLLVLGTAGAAERAEEREAPSSDRSIPDAEAEEEAEAETAEADAAAEVVGLGVARRTDSGLRVAVAPQPVSFTTNMPSARGCSVAPDTPHTTSHHIYIIHTTL
jgi:hypothetical protein